MSDYLSYELEGRLKRIKREWKSLEAGIPDDIKKIPLKEFTYEAKVNFNELENRFALGEGYSGKAMELTAELKNLTVLIHNVIKEYKLRKVDKDITIPQFVDETVKALLAGSKYATDASYSC